MLKPTRVDLAGDAFRVVLSSASADLNGWAGLAYRADGWPLCPRCGEDELASVLSLGGRMMLKGSKLGDARQAAEEEFLENRERKGRTGPFTDAERKALHRALTEASFRRAKPTDEMKCYRCGWNGGVPRRDEAEAWGKLGR